MKLHLDRSSMEQQNSEDVFGKCWSVQSCYPSFHIIPVGDNAVLNGIFQGQNTSLALGFISHVTVLLVHANHNSGHLWPADNARENCSRSIIACKASLAHATAVVNDQSCHLRQRKTTEDNGQQRTTTDTKYQKLSEDGRYIQ